MPDSVPTTVSEITRVPVVGDLVVYHSSRGTAFRAEITRVFADDSEPTGEKDAEGGDVWAANGKARPCSPCHLLVDVPHDNTDPEFGTPDLIETDESGVPFPSSSKPHLSVALPEPTAHRSDEFPKTQPKTTRYFKPVPKTREYCAQGHSAQPEPGHFCYPTDGAP